MKYLDILEPSPSQARNGIVGLIAFQADFVSDLETVFIVPCFPEVANLDLGLLTPKITLNGKTVLVLMHLMSAVRKRSLKGAIIGSASPVRDSLVRAIDLLVTGH
jgi:hypothetical protein